MSLKLIYKEIISLLVLVGLIFINLFLDFGDFNITKLTLCNDSLGVCTGGTVGPAESLLQTIPFLSMPQINNIPNVNGFYLDLVFTNNNNDALSCSDNHLVKCNKHHLVHLYV